MASEDALKCKLCKFSTVNSSNDFTDMTIVCDKREFHCHKFMLAARYA